MANIPWHEEVLGFVHKLAERLEGYEMACEHEHSNCVLLAHQKVRGMGVGGEEERWREEGREVGDGSERLEWRERKWKREGKM